VRIITNRDVVLKGNIETPEVLSHQHDVDIVESSPRGPCRVSGFKLQSHMPKDLSCCPQPQPTKKQELRPGGSMRQLSDGRIIGGGRFGVGALAHLLKNRFYIGEVGYRGSIYRSEHQPIVDAALSGPCCAHLDL
jgi:hypothetical protein